MKLPPFQAFLDDHRQDVHRFLVASVGPHDADDAFQETFIAALRNYKRLEPGSNLKGWVLTIAHRKAIDQHRARRRRPVPVDEVPERPVRDGHPALDGRPELWQAVRELPPKQRTAVAHRFVNDLQYEQIGEIMGTSQEAARRNVYEGLEKLRKVWQP